jgi:hypothetical protein
MDTEFDRMRRENRQLRLALICLVAIGAAAAGFGVGAAQPSGNDRISIASDGEYLYRLTAGGWIERINIEAIDALETRLRLENKLPPERPTIWQTFARN